MLELVYYFRVRISARATVGIRLSVLCVGGLWSRHEFGSWLQFRLRFRSRLRIESRLELIIRSL